VCLSVGACEGGGKTIPRERVSRAAAEGRRAECVCEAESELESVSICICSRAPSLARRLPDPTSPRCRAPYAGTSVDLSLSL